MGTLPSVSSASLPSSIRTIEYKAAHPSFGLSQQMYCRAFKRLDRLQHHSFPFCAFACGGASASSINLHRLVAIHPQARPVEEVPRSKSEETAGENKKKKNKNATATNEIWSFFFCTFHPSILDLSSPAPSLWRCSRQGEAVLKLSATLGFDLAIPNTLSCGGGYTESGGMHSKLRRRRMRGRVRRLVISGSYGGRRRKNLAKSPNRGKV